MMRWGSMILLFRSSSTRCSLIPKSAAALGGLARSYENSGRIAEAEKTFQDAAAMRPDNWYGYNELGAFYGRQGKYPQALTAYQRGAAYYAGQCGDLFESCRSLSGCRRRAIEHPGGAGPEEIDRA